LSSIPFNPDWPKNHLGLEVYITQPDIIPKVYIFKPSSSDGALNERATLKEDPFRPNSLYSNPAFALHDMLRVSLSSKVILWFGGASFLSPLVMRLGHQSPFILNLIPSIRPPSISVILPSRRRPHPG
jgi:hypothetical protein